MAQASGTHRTWGSFAATFESGHQESRSENSRSFVSRSLRLHKCQTRAPVLWKCHHESCDFKTPGLTKSARPSHDYIMFRLTADLEGLDKGMMDIREMTDHSTMCPQQGNWNDPFQSSTTYSQEDIARQGIVHIQSSTIRSITLVATTIHYTLMFPGLEKTNKELITNTRWHLKGWCIDEYLSQLHHQKNAAH